MPEAKNNQDKITVVAYFVGNKVRQHTGSGPVLCIIRVLFYLLYFVFVLSSSPCVCGSREDPWIRAGCTPGLGKRAAGGAPRGAPVMQQWLAAAGAASNHRLIRKPGTHKVHGECSGVGVKSGRSSVIVEQPLFFTVVINALQVGFFDIDHRVCRALFPHAAGNLLLDWRRPPGRLAVALSQLSVLATKEHVCSSSICFNVVHMLCTNQCVACADGHSHTKIVTGHNSLTH